MHVCGVGSFFRLMVLIEALAKLGLRREVRMRGETMGERDQQEQVPWGRGISMG